MSTGERGVVRVAVDVQAAAREEPERRVAEEACCRVVVLGDFAGEAGPAGQAGGRRPHAVDRDNFDAVLARLAPRCTGRIDVEGRETQVPLEFRALEDFHPDGIAARAEPFRRLLESRRDVLGAGQGGRDRPPPADRRDEDLARAAMTPPPGPPGAAVLDAILAEHEGAAPRGKPEPDAFHAAIERLVAPFRVHVDEAQQARALAELDDRLGAWMRAVLHGPGFRHLEAAWRSLWQVVTAVEDETTVRVEILQCTKGELDGMLAVEDTAGLAGPLGEDPRGVPPALLVGNYVFDHGPDDLRLLERMGRASAALGAPFVAAAAPELLGAADFPAAVTDRGLVRRLAGEAYAAWRALRGAPEARWLALALPRTLCRLPYGAETVPLEMFLFEESRTPGRRAGELLWANPAFAVARAAVQAFGQDGWACDLGRGWMLEDLPFYVYREDGESATMPCAEVWLSDAEAQTLLDLGLVPLVGERGADRVMLPSVVTLSGAPLRLRAAG